MDLAERQWKSHQVLGSFSSQWLPSSRASLDRYTCSTTAVKNVTLLKKP